MSLNDLRILSGFGNGDIASIENIEFTELIAPPVKSDFYINSPLMKIDKTVVPVLTVKRGRVFEPEWGPHPWGWEPERVG